MRPVTGTRRLPGESQTLAARAREPKFIIVHGSDIANSSLAMINKVRASRSLQPEFIDASQLTAAQAVTKIVKRMGVEDHLLFDVHGNNLSNAENAGRPGHHVHLGEHLPAFPTESLIHMIVDELGITPHRVDQSAGGLPFIYLLSCEAGELRRQISPGSDLWKRANLLIFSGTRSTSVSSSGSSLAGAIAYVDHCKNTRQRVDPMKLLFFAGLNRGDCVTMMGGRLRAPLVWHAPKSGQDQNRIDTLSGTAEDKACFEKAITSLKDAEFRLLPPASLTEVVCNRLLRDDADRLDELLEAHPELACTPSLLGILPLEFAAAVQASRCLPRLLAAGADPNVQGAGGKTALMRLVGNASTPPRIGDIETLLACGADPNLRSEQGSTALIFACAQNYSEATRVLLDGGADTDVCTQDGLSALMLAARQGNVASLTWLLSHHPDLDLQNAHGATALMMANQNGHFDAVRILLDGGADPNVQDVDGFSALMQASRFADIAPMQLLLEGGADPDLQNIHGVTALMSASMVAHTNAMRVLLERGADPDLQNNDGVTALMYAIDRADPAPVQLLLAHGARMDLVAANGNSCLTLATIGLRADILQLLLAAGAGPSAGLSQALVDQTRARGAIQAAELLRKSLEASQADQKH